jgi:hypothetical protein|tara:strand:- start:3156 stop:3299 length:144 start_codon:yes stop_codon:yes gene_type:complete
MTKLKKTKLKSIVFTVSIEDEAEFRKEIEPILEKYKRYRYQRATQNK